MNDDNNDLIELMRATLTLTIIAIMLMVINMLV